MKACTAAGSIRGEKSAFIAHILGSRGVDPCAYASDAAKADATEQRLAMAQKAAEKDNNSTASTQKRAHPESSNNPTLDGSRKKFKQAPLKTYRGIDMPFSEDEKNAVQAQALRAVISANLPFRAMENPEMLKLFRLLRTAAPEIIPSRRIIGGRLLDDAAATVDAKMRKMLRGREVGVV